MAMAAEAPGSHPDEPPYSFRARRFDPEWLERALILRGISLEELARKADIALATAWNARRGGRMDPLTMSAVLKVLADNPPLMEIPER